MNIKQKDLGRGFDRPYGVLASVLVSLVFLLVAGIAVAAPLAPANLQAYRGRNNQEFRFTATGTTSGGTVWGTNNLYTDDSHVATAAVHHGILRAGQTGIITVRIMPGRNSYQGSTRNGVTSRPWTRPWPGSFSFVGKANPPAGTQPKPKPSRVQVTGQIMHYVNGQPRSLGGARVIIGRGFNYRGPSEVAGHVLYYRSIAANVGAGRNGRFLARIPTGRYEFFFWRRGYVPHIFRNVRVTGSGRFRSVALSKGRGPLGSHDVRLRLIKRN